MTQSNPDPAPSASIPGFKMLLLGETGRGKTHSIRTLLDAGVTPFVVFTEQGMDTLADLPPDACHWHYIPPAKFKSSGMGGSRMGPASIKRFQRSPVVVQDAG